MTSFRPGSALSLTGWVTLDKLLDLWETWFPYLKNVNNTDIQLCVSIIGDEYAKYLRARYLKGTSRWWPLVSFLYSVTDLWISEWVGMPQKHVLRLLLLIVKWKSLFSLRNYRHQQADRRVHSKFIPQGHTVYSIYNEILKQLRNSVWYPPKKKSPNWLNVNAAAYCKFYVNCWPQILGRFPTLLRLNLNEVQNFPKVNLSWKYRGIFYWKLFKRIYLKTVRCDRTSNELVAKRNGFSF